MCKVIYAEFYVALEAVKDIYFVHTDGLVTNLAILLSSTEVICGQSTEGSGTAQQQQTVDRECSRRMRQTLQSLHLHQLGGQFRHLSPSSVHRHGP